MDWVHDQIDARNKKITEEQDMYVSLDPEVARIFESSTSVAGRLPFGMCFDGGQVSRDLSPPI